MAPDGPPGCPSSHERKGWPVQHAGYNNAIGYLASAELCHPDTATRTSAGRLATACAAHTATGLPDGQVLVAGGWGEAGPLASAQVYR